MLGTVKERLSRELTRERGSVEGLPASTSSTAATAVQQVLYSQKEHLRRLRTGEETGLDPAEALRRLRISESNKGKVPWNKGVKHSPGAWHACLSRLQLERTLHEEATSAAMIIQLGTTAVDAIYCK